MKQVVACLMSAINHSPRSLPVYLEVRPVVFSQACFWVNVNRIAAIQGSAYCVYSEISPSEFSRIYSVLRKIRIAALISKA